MQSQGREEPVAWEVRKAGLEHSAELTSLFGCAEREFGLLRSTATGGALGHRPLARLLQKCDTFVALADTKVLGFASFEMVQTSLELGDQHCVLLALFVVPEYRRRGVGR